MFVWTLNDMLYVSVGEGITVFVWTLNDMLYVTVGCLLMAAWMLVSIATWWKQTRCKHDGGVNETQACDAVCRKCGKNLGFIGNWRKRNGT